MPSNAVAVESVREISPTDFEISYHFPERPNEHFLCRTTAGDDPSLIAAIAAHQALRAAAPPDPGDPPQPTPRTIVVNL